MILNQPFIYCKCYIHCISISLFVRMEDIVMNPSGNGSATILSIKDISIHYMLDKEKNIDHFKFLQDSKFKLIKDLILC